MPLPRRPRLAAAVLLLVLLAGWTAAPGRAQSPADTLRFPEGEEPVRVGVRPIPSAFYSASKGFGVGVRVSFRNVNWRGDRLELSAEPMTMFGRYGLRYLTGDPYRTPLYVLAAVEYTTTGSYRYYGLGPRSEREDKLFVSLRMVEGELRGGWYPLGTGRLLVQPVARVLYTRVRSFRDDADGAFSELDPASQRNLLLTVDDPSTGLDFSLDLVYDGRDDVGYASRGVLAQLTGRRYEGLDGTPFRLWSGAGSLYGFVPTPVDRLVVVGRAVVSFTRSAGGEEIPFFALQPLDSDLLGGYGRYRFSGRDFLALTAGLRFPAAALFGYRLDGFAGGHVANAYDDLFRQIAPRVAFGEDLGRPEDRAPLRPSFVLGAYVLPDDEERVIISGQLGVTPEGLAVTALRIVYDLRSRKPVVR